MYHFKTLSLGLQCVIAALMVTTQTVLVFSQPQNAPGNLGCFEEECLGLLCPRALPRGPISSNYQSSEWCFKRCLEDEPVTYKYAGLEFQHECFCGNNEDYDRFGRKPESDCQNRCTGNSNQICGGFFRISIYRISQGVCSNDIGPPANGDHTINNPRSLSYNLNNFKFFRTRVDFSCDVGYTLHGASSIECIDTGYNNVTWSDAVPTCQGGLESNTIGTTKTNKPTETAGTESGNERWNAGVVVGPLVAGFFITGLIALALLILLRRRKRQLVRNESIPELRNNQSRSLARNRSGSSTEAKKELPAIPLTTVVTSPANDVCPEYENKPVQLPYGNIGPNLSFSRDLVEIGKEVGRGVFGRVLLGTVLGIEGVGKRSKVAIKTIKEGADRQAKVELLKELDVMKKIGFHPNIVRLLGYCIETDPIYIIVEYLGKGDLKKVLVGYRTTDTGSDYTNISGPSRSLSLRLLKFARDVADGMTYLASQKCIHRDLAARNVLVDDNMVCKVSDFGLARDVINIRVYQRESKGPLPMRWMALESLLDDVYTIQSDVWSFGILMWEIVTLGARPYPHIMTAKDMVHQLRGGYRMAKPTNCKKELYSIMRSCWYANPQSRPTFQEILEKIEGLLGQEMDYITVNHIDERIYEVPSIMDEKEKL